MTRLLGGQLPPLCHSVTYDDVELPCSA
jgi:hypothetical protein